MDHNQEFWNNQHNLENQRALSGCSFDATVDFLNVRDLIVPGMHVLEIGCGLGYVTKGFSEIAKISVLDISPIALDRVRPICENVYHMDDSETLPTDYFDLIICHNVVQHVPTAPLRIELKHAIRSLKSTGTFAVEYVWANDSGDDGVIFEPSWATAGHLCRSDKFMMELVQELGGVAEISRTNLVPRHKKIHGLTVLHIKKPQQIVEAIHNDITVMSDWKSNEVLDKFCDIMNRPGPLFFSRIGGSDYNCVKTYFNDNSIVDDLHWYKNELYSVKSHNGYFDFENKQENFIKYLEAMIESYQNSDAFMYGNVKLIESFDSNQFLSNEAKFVNHFCKNKVCINYSFIEGISPFLKSFDRWATGKKILVVSPLSASVEHQYKNRDNLYRDYRFPDFDLLTYNTKITYSDEGDDPSILNVNTNNWLEEAQRMAEEISKIEFDIALLSCGSYAMYLGNFIKNNLSKKSLYVGGALNMIFNIYGGRYNHPGYRRLKNSVGLIPESQINPIENKDIEHMKSGRNFKSESLNAYFGVKKE